MSSLTIKPGKAHKSCFDLQFKYDTKEVTMITVKNRSYLFVVLLFSFGTTVWAGDCSVEALKGDFGFTEQGTLVKTLPGLPAPLPYASTGIASFDGTGHLSGKVTANFGGVAVSLTFSGTYAVNPDCTFTTQFTNSAGLTLSQAGVIVGQGVFQEGRYIHTDDTIVASGVSKRPASGK